MKELTICFSSGGKKDEGRMREKRDGADRKQRAESKKTPQLIVSILPLPSISQMAAGLLTHKNTYTQIVLWPPAYTADSPSDES